MRDARQAIRAPIKGDSKPTEAPSERVRELSGVLRLVKAEQANSLYLSKSSSHVNYHA